jgi:hypothetical protein
MDLHREVEESHMLEARLVHMGLREEMRWPAVVAGAW